MKRIQVFLWLMGAAILMFVAACSDISLVEPDEGEEVASAVAAKNHAVPITARAWGSGAFGGAPGDCMVAGMPGLPIVMSGEGIVTHMGRIAAVHAGHCLNLNNFTYEGTVTIIAADGDELWATYAGQALPDGSFESTGTYVGGTGRFDGASGFFVQHGAGTDPSTGSFTFEFITEGTVVY